LLPSLGLTPSLPVLKLGLKIWLLTVSDTVEELVKTLPVLLPARRSLITFSTYGPRNKTISSRDASTLPAVAMEKKLVTTPKWFGLLLLKLDVVSLLVSMSNGTICAANTTRLVTLLVIMFTPTLLLLIKRQERIIKNL